MKIIQLIGLLNLFLLTACNQIINNDLAQDQSKKAIVDTNSGSQIQIQIENSPVTTTGSRESSGAHDIIHTGLTSSGIILLVESSGSETTFSGNIIASGGRVQVPTGVIYTGASLRKKVLEKFDPAFGYDPDNIMAIKSLDELGSLNPTITSIPGSDKPNFLTLQKDQILLSIYGAQIKDPEYAKLRQQQMDIYQGKDLWDQSLKDMDTAFFDAVKIKSGDTQSLLAKKSQALQEFQRTVTYREYIKTKQSELTEITLALRKYWTPDMIKLQDEIDILRQEIYGSGATVS